MTILGERNMTWAFWILGVVASYLVVAATPVGSDIFAEWAVVRAIVDGHDPHQSVIGLAAIYGIDAGRWYDVSIPRTPGALLVMLPLALIPLDVLLDVATGLVVALVAGTAWALSRLAGLPSRHFAVAMPLFFLSEVGSEIAHHRHVTMALSPLLMALAWMELKRRRTGSTGVLLGIATTFRLYPWVIAASFVPRKTRVALWALGSFVVLNLGGLLLPGVSFGAAVSGIVGGGAEFVGESRNGSLVSLLNLPVWTSVALGLLFLALMWGKRGWNLAIPVSLLIAPLAWTMYLPVLLVPLAARRRIELLVALPTVWLLWRFSPLTYTEWTSWMTFGSILVVTVDEWVALRRTGADSAPGTSRALAV